MIHIQTTKQYQTIQSNNQQHQTNNPMEEALTTRHHMLQQHTLTDITTDTNTQKEADGKKQNRENGNTYNEIKLFIIHHPKAAILKNYTKFLI